MKKIGFIDYYISEWHANTYIPLIEKANEVLGTDYKVSYAYGEKYVSLFDNATTDEWCEKYGVTKCETIAEVCEKSDVLFILAPSNPEKHLPFARETLKFGKPTYIDKTFAPNEQEAKEIFSIAQKYGTPFFSTSALRYAEELKEFQNVTDLVITTGGSNFEEYCIHMIEMAVMLLKAPFKKISCEKIGNQAFCRVSADRTDLMLVYSPCIPTGIYGKNENGEYIGKAVTSDFFTELLTDIIRFFETGKIPFDTNETLEVMRLRDALINAYKGE